jgi:two-component system cell cycle response regulator DivK
MAKKILLVEDVDDSRSILLSFCSGFVATTL